MQHNANLVRENQLQPLSTQMMKEGKSQRRAAYPQHLHLPRDSTGTSPGNLTTNAGTSPGNPTTTAASAGTSPGNLTTTATRTGASPGNLTASTGTSPTEQTATAKNTSAATTANPAMMDSTLNSDIHRILPFGGTKQQVFDDLVESILNFDGASIGLY